MFSSVTRKDLIRLQKKTTNKVEQHATIKVYIQVYKKKHGEKNGGFFFSQLNTEIMEYSAKLDYLYLKLCF